MCIVPWLNYYNASITHNLTHLSKSGNNHELLNICLVFCTLGCEHFVDKVHDMFILPLASSYLTVVNRGGTTYEKLNIGGKTNFIQVI